MLTGNEAVERGWALVLAYYQKCVFLRLFIFSAARGTPYRRIFLPMRTRVEFALLVSHMVAKIRRGQGRIFGLNDTLPLCEAYQNEDNDLDF